MGEYPQGKPAATVGVEACFYRLLRPFFMPMGRMGLMGLMGGCGGDNVATYGTGCRGMEAYPTRGCAAERFKTKCTH